MYVFRNLLYAFSETQILFRLSKSRAYEVTWPRTNYQLRHPKFRGANSLLI